MCHIKRLPAYEDVDEHDDEIAPMGHDGDGVELAARRVEQRPILRRHKSANACGAARINGMRACQGEEAAAPTAVKSLLL